MVAAGRLANRSEDRRGRPCREGVDQQGEVLNGDPASASERISTPGSKFVMVAKSVQAPNETMVSTTMVSTTTIVGMYVGFLRWCEMGFVHPQCVHLTQPKMPKGNPKMLRATQRPEGRWKSLPLSCERPDLWPANAKPTGDEHKPEIDDSQNRGDPPSKKSCLSVGFPLNRHQQGHPQNTGPRLSGARAAKMSIGKSPGLSHPSGLVSFQESCNWFIPKPHSPLPSQQEKTSLQHVGPMTQDPSLRLQRGPTGKQLEWGCGLRVTPTLEEPSV